MPNPADDVEALKAQVAALTARIDVLEQRLGGFAPQRPQDPVPLSSASAGKAEPPKPFPALPATRQPASPASLGTLSGSRTVKTESTSLEKKIGQYWLNRIGIVAVLVGVSYFLKWAFDNNLIGPTGRVLIGVLLGIGLILWSERFRARGHAPFSYSLKAVGIGTLYLSLWAAAQYFHPPLISVSMAFTAMVLVTAATIVMALTQNAQLLAAFALVGGFATPVLVSTGENHEIALFSYVCLLDLAVLVMTTVRPWRRLLWGSFCGTQILYWGWYIEHYSGTHDRPLTLLFASLLAAIFAIIPLATPFERSTRFKGPSVTLIVVPLLNAASFFLALLALYESKTETLTWYALALAAAYLFLSNAFKRRVTQEEGRVINLIHVAIAVAFITIAIPLKLSHHWITLGWLVEAAVLLWIAVRTKTDFLRYLAVVALVLGIFRLLVFPISADTLIFNARFATYAVAIAVLGGIVYFGGRASEAEQGFVRVAGIALNVLALISLTLEAMDYFNRRQIQSYALMGRGGGYQEFWLEREFAYSAVWILYGAGLMAVGFWRRSAFIRWQGLVLMAVTIVKVFLYDSRYLNTGYRVLSFIALGVVLLAISFVYFRSSSHSSENTPPETSP
jgi:uncharacterized membrane protein